MGQFLSSALMLRPAPAASGGLAGLGDVGVDHRAIAEPAWVERKLFGAWMTHVEIAGGPPSRLPQRPSSVAEIDALAVVSLLVACAEERVGLAAQARDADLDPGQKVRRQGRVLDGADLAGERGAPARSA
jgi:hypothetical protein